MQREEVRRRPRGARRGSASPARAGSKKRPSRRARRCGARPRPTASAQAHRRRARSGHAGQGQQEGQQEQPAGRSWRAQDDGGHAGPDQDDALQADGHRHRAPDHGSDEQQERPPTTQAAAMPNASGR